MSNETPAPLHSWLAMSMEPASRVIIDRTRRAADVVHVAVMPDVHPASDVCVGTAMATTRLVYPSAVGGDIGCGMLAIAFDADASILRDPQNAGTILRHLREQIPIQRRHRARLMPMPDDLDVASLSHSSLKSELREVGMLQLGTLGGGNHFIEFQADGEGRLWLMIHSGSRHMGQAVRAHHVAKATIRSASMMALDATGEQGQAYLHDQMWARKYARANREAMGDVVKQMMLEEFKIAEIAALRVGCDHNHVQWEEHFSQQLLVHRKGAMPASAGLAGVVPGSMGTCSFHVVGKGNELSLKSSAHGAGRLLSRSAAKERFAISDVRRQMDGIWFDPRRVEGMREEAPKSYKDVRKVMDAQGELVEVVRVLKPVLVFKGA